MNNYDIAVLQVSDLMQILKIGKNKAYALMHSPSFPSIQVGRTYVVSKTELKKWLDINVGKQVKI